MSNDYLSPTARRGVPRKLRKALALDDFEEMARRHLPRPIFGYVAGASETNASFEDNRAAFTEYAFRPRILVDVSKRSQETTLFDHTYAVPFGIAPVGFAALTAYRGDLVLATTAAEANMPMIMSGTSLIRLEDVAKEAPRSWFQAYLPGERDWILALVDRVARAGFGTLVLTVDMPVVANRENNIRNGFSAPLNPSLRLAWDGMIRPNWTINTFLKTFLRHGMPYFENSSADRGPPILSRSVARHFGAKDHLNWSHFALIRERWKGRLIIKGIMTAEDARIAVESGADGIMVSNHGGRQLDGTAAPLRALPEIAETVAGRIPVMMDGGIRRGSDVLKAIALGATFVFLGRSFMFAAAVAGAPGVLHAFKLLRDEVDRDMGMLGINSLSEMTMDRLMRLK